MSWKPIAEVEIPKDNDDVVVKLPHYLVNLYAQLLYLLIYFNIVLTVNIKQNSIQPLQAIVKTNVVYFDVSRVKEVRGNLEIYKKYVVIRTGVE